MSFRAISFIVFFFLFFILPKNVFPSADPQKSVITIKNIQLKNDLGEWLTIIEPDHQVDLATQDPTVSFLNNGRRVKPGKYENFRIVINSKEESRDIQLFGKENFIKPLEIRKRSFINISFELYLKELISHSRVKKAVITIDDQTLDIPGEAIQMVLA